MLSLAEWERETIRDRIRAGVDRAADEGRTGGSPPVLDSEKQQAFLANNNGNVSAAHRNQSARPDRDDGTPSADNGLR